MTVVDAFLAMRYDNPGADMDCFSSFCGKLCFQLINNMYLVQRQDRKRRGEDRDHEDDEVASIHKMLQAVIIFITGLSSPQRRNLRSTHLAI